MATPSITVEADDHDDHETVYPPKITIGESGRGPPITLPDHLARDLIPMKFPRAATITALAETYFPSALAISFILDGVVVELEPVSETDFRAALEGLARGFTNSDVRVRFYNGWSNPRGRGR